MIVKKINQLIWGIVDKKDKKRLAKQNLENKNVIVKTNVKYAEGERSLLDIYVPKNFSGKLPLIINVPGGGYTIGEKENNKVQSQIFAEKGFAVVTINYHRASEGNFPAPVKDLFNVFKFVENNFQNSYIDLDNVFLMGDSAGAHVAALAGAMKGNHLMQEDFEVYSNINIRACAFFSGSFQILNLPIVKNGYKKAIYGNQAVYHEVTKITDVMTENFPPNIVVCPANDFLLLQSLNFNKRCKQLGVENNFIKIKKGKSLGHVSMIKYANHNSYNEVYNQVATFLKDKVKAKEIEFEISQQTTAKKPETKQKSKTNNKQNLNKEIEM